MARIRHIAISVPDPKKTAEFYMKTFGLKQLGETNSPLATGVYLSDGFVNVALLKYKTDEAAGKERGKDYVGIHHFGFQVEDLKEAGSRIEDNGGTFFLDLPEQKETLYYEQKWRDPNGIIFDISHHGWVGASE
jgi:methylmalonyl-CoA/ethylmalonyl-CoA epimerase